jgi:hypothetical protein
LTTRAILDLFAGQRPLGRCAYFNQQPEVTVQLTRTNASTCWQSVFSLSNAINNTQRQFKAKIN